MWIALTERQHPHYGRVAVVAYESPDKLAVLAYVAAHPGTWITRG